MHQTVKDHRGGKLAGKQFIPSAYWQVGCNHEGVLFAPLADHLEEKGKYPKDCVNL